MNTYCSIYLNSELESYNLAQMLAVLLNGKIDSFNSISVKDGDIDITDNSEYNKLLQVYFPDGFLYFKYKIELTFAENTNINFCIELVKTLLHFLWNKGYSAVASCEYEEYLPLKGGYNSRSIPWPKENNLS